MREYPRNAGARGRLFSPVPGALSSAYEFLAGTRPFGVVEAIWTLVALNPFRQSDPYLRVRDLAAPTDDLAP
jgi:hypothetical protein